MTPRGSKAAVLAACLGALLLLAAGEVSAFTEYSAELTGQSVLPVPVFDSVHSGTFLLEADWESSNATYFYYSLEFQDFMEEDGLIRRADLYSGNSSATGNILVSLYATAQSSSAGSATCKSCFQPPTGVRFTLPTYGEFTPSDIGRTGAAMAPITLKRFRELLESGNTYVQVRTSRYPAGAMRGQIVPMNGTAPVVMGASATGRVQTAG